MTDIIRWVIGFGVALVFESLSAEPSSSSAVQRLERPRLAAVHLARQQFERDRQQIPGLGVHQDYRAVIHVHAEDSDHTKGTREEVLAAAKKTGVHVVMLTDHAGPNPETWRGSREGVLFIAGAEESNGVLRFPRSIDHSHPTDEKELRFLCHVEERYDAVMDEFAGMEICNRHTDAKLDGTDLAHLKACTTDPEKWQRIVEDQRAYPDEFFAAGTAYRPEIFAKWDRELEKGRVAGIGGNDAHQNTALNGIVFDPYEVSFRNLSTHILAQELTEPAICEALAKGRAYVSHDWLCDPTGFLFVAGNNLGIYTMGDAIPWVGKTRLYVRTPLTARLKLIHQGKVIREMVGTGLTNEVAAAGAYRVEAWLSVDNEERPWIYSNPIYVAAPSADDLRFPPMELSAGVERIADLSYLEDSKEAKHKLDIYRAAGTARAPVLFFVHGGAWRSGDRSLYVPLGNRFAREGLVTVIPSYRLAPDHPHPAQIEDTAAALAWTIRHVGEHGGDTNRVYLGGHSAGGHLVALLALQPRFLQRHHLSTEIIRGVAALSGVFDLTGTEGQSSVFGRDPEARREASPMFHIRGGAPRFLVSFCEWDYLTLPAQARQFHAALLEAGLASEQVFIAQRNHISEMLTIDRDGDPTAAAVLDFVRKEGRSSAAAGQ